MPTNVTPEFERAERRYREAGGDDEKLDALREMLSTIPKHKGTEKMQADIKRRISQLSRTMAKGRRAGRKGPDPFHVPKTGAGQAILIGPPNSGKSSLLAATTNAHVKIGQYPFTTALPAPGMWLHEDVQIQLVDTPPIVAGHVVAGLTSTIRLADVVCLVIDAAGEALEEAEMVLGVLAEKGLTLRSVPLNELDPKARGTQSGLLLLNKTDLASPGDVATFRDLYAEALEIRAVSAATGRGLNELRGRLWELLAAIRVYTKQPGKPADYSQPFTLPIGSTVEDFARQIHRELPDKLKFARIWGHGKFDGQHVHRTETLQDKDVVEIHE